MVLVAALSVAQLPAAALTSAKKPACNMACCQPKVEPEPPKADSCCPSMKVAAPKPKPKADRCGCEIKPAPKAPHPAAIESATFPRVQVDALIMPASPVQILLKEAAPTSSPVYPRLNTGPPGAGFLRDHSGLAPPILNV
jgi:hypothetical protein